MQTENLEGQESIFDRDSACGKMSSVLSQVGGTLKRVKKSLGRIFKKSSKRSSKLKKHTARSTEDGDEEYEDDSVEEDIAIDDDVPVATDPRWDGLKGLLENDNN